MSDEIDLDEIRRADAEGRPAFVIGGQGLRLEPAMTGMGSPGR